MKKIYNYIKPTFAWLIFMIFVNDITAQCPNNNTQWGSSAQSTTVGYTQTLTTCIYGGEYRYVYNLQAGSQYAFETCGDSDFDTQISIYDASTGAALAYNDDYCGLQSRASFVSNGNAVRVLVDRYYCSNQSSCMTLKGTRLTGGAPPNPCNSITTLTCTNNTGSFSLTGPGAWNPPGPWGTPGAEKVFKFTATQSGAHTINVTNSGYYVDLFIKGGSCSGSGWTFIDDIYTSGSNTGNLTAGVTYYFLIDDENTSPSSGTLSITCPSQAVDPCASITALTCDVNSGFSLSGSGAWNPPGPWGTPGEEAVFSYTPPISGTYDIQVLNSGYYVDLFYSTSCGSSGWTYISDIYTNETNSVSLVGGVTYYFLIDDENTAASSGAINISCPCYPPPGGIDASVVVNSNTSYSSTTVGACNDCSLRPSKDRVLEMEITCAGTYTFSTCNNATWDTYLYLTTQPCGGSIIALNDDACSLRSSITSTLAVGTYYLAIEGWSSSSQGAFTVDISKACDLNVSLAADVVNCGYNISCNGANDGSITATSNGCSPTYAWSNGSSGAVASGLGAGTYSVTVSDGFGCSASASANLTEPDPLVVDAGQDQTVYYGYTPLSCANLSGSATGGCQAYDYSWSNGNSTNSQTVCPSTSTSYTLTVTDDNGCTADDMVDICVVDVICYAGNSNNQKVEMCHVTGNGSSHDICISPNAVPAHLAHGCSLGACSEINACPNSSARIGNSVVLDNDHDISIVDLTIMPNPFDSEVNISLTLSETGTYQIEVLDVFGRVVESVNSTGFKALENQIVNIQTDHFSKGMYLIRVTDVNSNYVGQSKLIIKN